MRFFSMCLILMACVALCLPQDIYANDDAKLLKVVVLSRHGVRSPTQSKKVLELWSQKTWPAWPGDEPGELTPRGAKLVSAMWQNLKKGFVGYGLLPDTGCPVPGSIFVRADDDERDKATSNAILNGLAPGCSIGVAVVEDKIDQLFHPLKAKLYQFNPVPLVTDILSMTDGGLDNLLEDFSGPLTLISKINGPLSDKMCAHFGLLPNCELVDVPNSVRVSSDGDDVSLRGSLDLASSMAEIFLLEYAQWPDRPAGWGEVNGTILSQILPVHSKIFDVINRAPVVAWGNGSSLLNEMAAALLNKHYDPRFNEARLVIFVGHDTNIANIGALLGINWQISSYPRNSIPPTSAIFLELWEKNQKQYVVVRFFAQSLKTLHSPFVAEKNGQTDSNDAILDLSEFSPQVTNGVMRGGREAYFDIMDFIHTVETATAGAPIAPRETLLIKTFANITVK